MAMIHKFLIGSMIVVVCGASAYVVTRAIDPVSNADPSSEQVTTSVAPDSGKKTTEPDVLVNQIAQRASSSRSKPLVAGSKNGSLLPPEDVPWEQAYEELMARAEAGDKKAASRLYRDTLGCLSYLSIKKSQLRGELDRYKGAQRPESVLRDYDKQLAKDQGQLKKYAPICEGVDQKSLHAALYPVMRQAAMLGDQRAATCYVDGGVFENSEGKLSPEQIKSEKFDYANHALEIARAGIKRGNWDMVTEFLRAYDSAPATIYGDRGWLGKLVKPDPLKTYSYTLLLKHVSNPEAAMNLKGVLENIRNTNNLSNSEVAVAKAWARTTYSDYFRGHPYPPGMHTTCGLQ